MNMPNINIIDILRGAIQEVAINWRALLRALILPAAGSSAIPTLWAQFGGPNSRSWTYLLAQGMLYALFATSCHRIILLGPNALPNSWGIYWTLREWRFLGWLILVAAIYFAVSLPISFLALLIPPQGGALHWYLVVFVWAYFEGRLSMVLPATATDQKMNLLGSWNLTRNNGFVIAIAIFLVAFAMDMIDRAIRLTLSTHAPVAASGLAELFVFPALAVAVGVVSVTYRELTKQDAQGRL